MLKQSVLFSLSAVLVVWAFGVIRVESNDDLGDKMS